MNETLGRLLGLPLLGVGAASLLGGLATSSYWPMSLGLAAMAYGALRWSDRW